MARSWRQIHLAAAVEAGRAHQELGTDLTRRIDPFAALEAAGIVVMRRRLDGVSGIYVPPNAAPDAAPGVLINAVHPLSRQRFTAAHELCHHRRDQAFIIDTHTEWIARGETGYPERERFAEAFAAWFLMPQRLVAATLAGLGFQADQLTPEGAYAVALELGTSYQATVCHLATMNLISATQRDRLLRSTPQAIKLQLGGVEAMADSWKDVWVVRPSRPDWEIGALAGDALLIEIPEAPSSGFRWQLAEVPDGLALVRDEYHPPEVQGHADPILGGRGQHRFLLRIDTAGRREVRWELRRPWQRDEAAETFAVAIAADAGPTAGIVLPHQLVSAA